MKTEVTTLKNGVKIIGIKMPSSKSVVINFGFRVGSRDEDPQYAGISHFLEHMMFKGSEKRPSAAAIAKEADRIGALYNAATEKEWTFYYIKTIQENFDLALDIVADMCIKPIIDETELNKERGTIIEEIRMYKDTPSADIDWRMEETMYGLNTPLGRDEGGTEESVNNINQKIMIEYFKQHYNAKKCFVAVAGDIPNGYIEKISTYIEDLKPVDTKDVIQPEYSKNRVRILNKKTEQAHIGFCLPDFSYNEGGQFASKLISTSLGGFMSSRLFSEIREKRGLAYHVASYNKKYQDHGSYCVVGDIKRDRLEEAVTIIKNELVNYNKKLTIDEIEKTKGHIKGSFTLRFDDPEARASFMIFQHMLSKNPITPEEYIDKIQNVSKEEIEETADKILKKDDLYLTVIGPYQNKEKFAKILTR